MFSSYLALFLKKTCEVAIAHRKSKSAMHARTSQVSKKWVRTRTLQLATAHCNSQLAIAYRKSCFDFDLNKNSPNH